MCQQLMRRTSGASNNSRNLHLSGDSRGWRRVVGATSAPLRTLPAPSGTGPVAAHGRVVGGAVRGSARYRVKSDRRGVTSPMSESKHSSLARQVMITRVGPIGGDPAPLVER